MTCDPALVCDQTGVVLEYDDEAQRFFGFEKDAVVGRHISTLIQLSSVGIFEDGLSRWKASDGTVEIKSSKPVESRRERAPPCTVELTFSTSTTSKMNCVVTFKGQKAIDSFPMSPTLRFGSLASFASDRFRFTPSLSVSTLMSTSSSDNPTPGSIPGTTSALWTKSSSNNSVYVYVLTFVCARSLYCRG